MAEHNLLGKWGEQVAVDYLISKGYTIAERNWRSGTIEIDIVAYYKNHIVFVEVKTRRKNDSRPEEAVDRRRAARMVRAADVYVRYKNIPHGIQYDIIAISGDPHEYIIYHIADAFVPRAFTRR